MSDNLEENLTLVENKTRDKIEIIQIIGKNVTPLFLYSCKEMPFEEKSFNCATKLNKKAFSLK
jgi:hypothetical protein